MGIGIQICGLNGCGKSTLGKALAERIGFYFIDNEFLYFSRPNADRDKRTVPLSLVFCIRCIYLTKYNMIPVVFNFINICFFVFFFKFRLFIIKSIY